MDSGGAACAAAGACGVAEEGEAGLIGLALRFQLWAMGTAAVLAAAAATSWALWHILHWALSAVVARYLDGIIEADGGGDAASAGKEGRARAPAFRARLVPQRFWPPLGLVVRCLNDGEIRRALAALDGWASGFGAHLCIDSAGAAPLRLSAGARGAVAEVLHNYLPIKLSLVGFRGLRVRLRALDVLLMRPGALRVHVLEGRVLGAHTHGPDWDMGKWVRWVLQDHQRRADFAWALLTGAPPYARACPPGVRELLRARLVDGVVDGLGVWVSDLHLCVEDAQTQTAMGVSAQELCYAHARLVPLAGAGPAVLPCAAYATTESDRYGLATGDAFAEASAGAEALPSASEATMMTQPRRIAALKLQAYVERGLEARWRPSESLLRCGRLSLQFELPSVLSTFGRTGLRGPTGQGKRLRLFGLLSDLSVDLRERQMNHLLYEGLKAFAVWERGAYWAHVAARVDELFASATPKGERLPRELLAEYTRHFHNAGRDSGDRHAKEAVRAIEASLPWNDILYLRCAASGFHSAADLPPMEAALEAHPDAPAGGGYPGPGGGQYPESWGGRRSGSWGGGHPKPRGRKRATPGGGAHPQLSEGAGGPRRGGMGGGGGMGRTSFCDSGEDNQLRKNSSSLSLDEGNRLTFCMSTLPGGEGGREIVAVSGVSNDAEQRHSGWDARVGGARATDAPEVSMRGNLASPWTFTLSPAITLTTGASRSAASRHAPSGRRQRPSLKKWLHRESRNP